MVLLHAKEILIAGKQTNKLCMATGLRSRPGETKELLGWRASKNFTVTLL